MLRLCPWKAGKLKDVRQLLLVGVQVLSVRTSKGRRVFHRCYLFLEWCQGQDDCIHTPLPHYKPTHHTAPQKDISSSQLQTAVPSVSLEARWTKMLLCPWGCTLKHRGQGRPKQIGRWVRANEATIFMPSWFRRVLHQDLTFYLSEFGLANGWHPAFHAVSSLFPIKKQKHLVGSHDVQRIKLLQGWVGSIAELSRQLLAIAKNSTQGTHSGYQLAVIKHCYILGRPLWDKLRFF